MTSGRYNANSSVQNAVMQPSINLLIEAVASLPKPAAVGGPIRIVDFGASQGGNSMQPCKAILDAIQSQKAQHQSRGGVTEVEVFHEDLPSNDWGSLLALVKNPMTTYIPKVDRSGVAACWQYSESLMSAAGLFSAPLFQCSYKSGCRMKDQAYL